MLPQFPNSSRLITSRLWHVRIRFNYDSCTNCSNRCSEKKSPYSLQRSDSKEWFVHVDASPQQSVHSARARYCRVACSDCVCHFSTSTEKISRCWQRSLSPPPTTQTRHLTAPLFLLPHLLLSLSHPSSEREISRTWARRSRRYQRRYPRNAQHGYNCYLHQVYRRISAVRRARKVSDRTAAFVWRVTLTLFTHCIVSHRVACV